MLIISHSTSTVFEKGKRLGYIPAKKYREVIDFIMASGGVSWCGSDMTPTPRRGLGKKVEQFIRVNLEK